MIKIIPLQMLCVSLIINFIVTQFQRACYKQSEQGGQDDQYPDFFIEIQNKKLPQVNGLRFVMFSLGFFGKNA